MRVEGEDEVGREILRESPVALGHDADHGDADILNVDQLSEDIRAAVEHPLPEPVGDDHDWPSGACQRRLVARKPAAQCKRDGDDRGAVAAQQFPVSLHDSAARGHRVDRRVVGAPPVGCEVRGAQPIDRRQWRVARQAPLIKRRHRNQLGRIGQRGRPKRQGIQHAAHRSGKADAGGDDNGDRQ